MVLNPTLWARIDRGCVVELTAIDPVGRYHPALVWVPAPIGTPVGASYDAGEFGPVAEEPPPERRLPLATVRGRMTTEQWEALTGNASSADMVLRFSQRHGFFADDDETHAQIAATGADPTEVLAP